MVRHTTMAIKTSVSSSLPLVLRLSRPNLAAAFTARFAAPLRITNNHSLPLAIRRLVELGLKAKGK
jgi:hypothetical protein